MSPKTSRRTTDRRYADGPGADGSNGNVAEQRGSAPPFTKRDEGKSTGHHRGQVKRLVRDRGFGFLISHSDGQEYFFHASSLANTTFDTLQEGDHVEWEGLNTMKGWRATNCVVSERDR